MGFFRNHFLQFYKKKLHLHLNIELDICCFCHVKSIKTWEIIKKSHVYLFNYFRMIRRLLKTKNMTDKNNMTFEIIFTVNKTLY